MSVSQVIQIENLRQKRRIGARSVICDVSSKKLCLRSQVTEAKREEQQKFLKDDIYVKHLEISSERTLSEIECSKKHEKFIECTKENKKQIKKSLPLKYRHDEMIDLIYSLADLTVKVEVNCKQNLNKKKGAVQKFDDNFIYQASGKIIDSEIMSCDKSKLATSAEDSKKGEISIQTSAKIITRASTNQHITCTLFDNEINSEVFKLTCWEIKEKDDDTDTCIFTCKTDDTELVKNLDNLIKLHNSCWLKAFNKYIQINSLKDKLAILVSHPHACPKHISIGRWEREIFTVKGRQMIRYKYDLPTCPGSNGADVMIPNFDDDGDIFFNF